MSTLSALRELPLLLLVVEVLEEGTSELDVWQAKSPTERPNASCRSGTDTFKKFESVENAVVFSVLYM